MTKTCAYIPFFNDEIALKRCLDSLVDAQLVICIDGRFPLYEDDFDYSTDGSRELVKSYTNTLLLDTGCNFMPIKNNLACRTAASMGYDAVLILGSDEYLEGDINGFNVSKDYPIYNIPLEEHNPTGKYNKPETVNGRLVVNPMFVRCVDVHWFWFYCNELIETHDMPIIDSITIHCDDLIRPRERDEKMTQYQDRNVPRERYIIQYKWIEKFLKMEYPPHVGVNGTMYYTCGCIFRPDGERLNGCVEHYGNKKPKYFTSIN